MTEENKSAENESVRKEPTQEEFLEMVNALIKIANRYADNNMSISAISDAMLYAAARYNTFLISIADKTKDLAAEKDSASRILVGRYQTFLDEHFDFHINEAS